MWNKKNYLITKNNTLVFLNFNLKKIFFTKIKNNLKIFHYKKIKKKILKSITYNHIKIYKIKNKNFKILKNKNIVKINTIISKNNFLIFTKKYLLKYSKVNHIIILKEKNKLNLLYIYIYQKKKFIKSRQYIQLKK